MINNSLNLDISVCDPRQLKSIIPVPGKAAKYREKAKLTHYAKKIESVGGIFSPFVIESFGRWGDAARKVFKGILDHMSLHSSNSFGQFPKAWLSHYWKARITMALHRQACVGMHKRIAAVIRTRQGTLKHKDNDMDYPFLETDDHCCFLRAVRPLAGESSSFLEIGSL